MATRKKNTAETKVETAVVKEEQKVQETPKAAPKSAKKEYKSADLIPCTSVTVGELICIGPRTGQRYNAFGYGDKIQIEYQDLLAFKMKRSSYLYMPYLTIDDDELLSDPAWEDIRDIDTKVYMTNDLDEFFDLPVNKMKAVLDSSPNGFKSAVRVMAMTKLDSGELDSINRIKMLDEVLGTDLQSLM